MPRYHPVFTSCNRIFKLDSALRLYERSGFTELCRYHYRTLAASQLP